CVLKTGNARSHMRPRAGRNQNRFCPHARAGREANSMCVLENGTGFHQSDLVALKRGDVRGFEPCNLAVLVGNQRGPMERWIRHCPAVASCIFKFVGKSRRVDQKLFRNTTAYNACPTNPIFLGDHNAGAMTGGDPRGTHASGTCPNNEKIDVVVRHQSLPALNGIASRDLRLQSLKARGLAFSIRRASLRLPYRKGCLPSPAQISYLTR